MCVRKRQRERVWSKVSNFGAGGGGSDKGNVGKVGKIGKIVILVP